MRGKVRAEKRAQQARAWLAWHTAYLPKMKKPVKLSDLMGSARPPRRKMTAAEGEAVANRWFRALSQAFPDKPTAKPTAKPKV